MKKRRLRKLGLLVLGLLAGGLIGIFSASYLFRKNDYSIMAVDRAIEISRQVAVVSSLRLGDTDDAIRRLETDIDNNILALVHTYDFTEKEYPHKVLSAAKTYREIYPSTSRFASKVTNLLEEYPKHEEFKCEGPLLRLLEQTQSQK